jgi:hypothetical protein
MSIALVALSFSMILVVDWLEKKRVKNHVP